VDIRIDEIVLRALGEETPELRFATAADFRTRVEEATVGGAAHRAGVESVLTTRDESAGPSLPATVFAVLYAALLVGLIGSAGALPERLASHFDGSGKADAWMSRPGYILLMGVMPLVLGGLLVGMGKWAKHLPSEHLKIPRREYWLAPEHRPHLDAILLRWFLWLACLMTVFFAVLHGITVVANRSVPPRLDSGPIIGLTVGVLLLVMVWVVSLVMRLSNAGEPPAGTIARTLSPAIRIRLIEEREGGKVVHWQGVLAAGLAVAAIATLLGGGLSLFLGGAIPLVPIVAGSVTIAFLIVGGSVLYALQSSPPHLSEPEDDAGPPRLSRSAIIGACWVPVTVLSFVGVAMASYQVRGGTSAGPEWWQLAVLIPSLILGVTGPFGTTILGWVAVSRIRRSAGRIHGLPLAVFDGLMYPLLILSGILMTGFAALARMFVEFYLNPSDLRIHPRIAFWIESYPAIAVLLSVVLVLAVNVIIVRAVLRALRVPVSESDLAPPPEAPGKFKTTLASIALIFALISGVLGALAALKASDSWPGLSFSLLFGGLAILMALPLRRLGTGKSAIIIAALGVVIWPLAALLVSHSTDAFHAVSEPSRHAFAAISDPESTRQPMAEPYGFRDKGDLLPWHLVFGIVLCGGIGSFVVFRRKGVAADKMVLGVLGVMSLLFFVTSLVLLGWRGQSAGPIEAPKDRSFTDLKVSSASPPEHMDFKVTRVENPPGSRVILLTFTRDTIYGLGLEVSQSMTPSADGKTPKPGYLDWQQKTFVGVSGGTQMAWHLPSEFTEEEARAVAKDVENRTKNISQLPDGARPEFANVKHRDGWTYTLLARVKREWGAPHPPAPPGAAHTFQRHVIVPNNRTVKLNLRAETTDGIPQPMDDPLIHFKTTRDRTSGFLLRWHAYGGGEQPGRVLLDLVDPDTGVTYHRFEHGFGTGVRFRILESLPLPDKNPSVMLVQPGQSAVLPLLAVEKILPPGVESGTQWQLLAKVEHVSPDEVNAIPLFQMPPGTGFEAPVSKPESETRTFPLRHKLARNAESELRRLLLGRPGHEARASLDDREITVTATPDMMKRVKTFLTVTDWPDTLDRGEGFEYPRLTPLVTARCFFYACAVEDVEEAISNLLSPGVLAELKNETDSPHYQTYQMGGIPDPQWEASLRADWPGKKDLLQRMMAEWNRHALTHIAEDPGVALGFGVKQSCTVVFEGLAQQDYHVTLEKARTVSDTGEETYYFGSLPPGWPVSSAYRAEPVTRFVSKPGSYDIKPGLKLVVTESKDETRPDQKPQVSGELIWEWEGDPELAGSHEIPLSDGLPYLVAWRADSNALWVSCGTTMGSGAEATIHRYLRVLKILSPGDVEERPVSLTEPSLDPADDEALKDVPADVRRAFEMLEP
jgi:hypothetical protein